jgi:hypothetical protein
MSRIKILYGVIFSKLPIFIGIIHHILNFLGANLNTGLYTVYYLCKTFNLISFLTPRVDKIVAYD